MRTFYLYCVNNVYSDNYDIYPYKLYKLIESIYYTNRYDINLSVNYYNQIIRKYNKLFVNNYLNANYNNSVSYKENDNIHTFSNGREYSVLMVSNYCLKLKSNINYPNFFNIIDKFSKNIFVCDFDNSDYFWLNKISKRNKVINIE